MLGAILKQLVHRDRIQEQIREIFQKAKTELGRGPLLPDMINILKKTITSLPRLFICIDALDECVPKHRRSLLESLREIVAVSPNIRVFLTGRPIVRAEIMIAFSQVVLVTLGPSARDFESYLEMRLDHDAHPEAMDDRLRAEIMRIIPQVSNM